MRIGPLLLASSLVACAAACHRESNTTSVAANGPAIQSDPVGPIPGAPENVVYSTNPLATDPVALQDGRRLFNWYNCSGCHGGRGGRNGTESARSGVALRQSG